MIIAAFILGLMAIVAIVYATRTPRFPAPIPMGEPVDNLDASIRLLADRVAVSEELWRKVRIIVRVGGVSLVALALVVVAVKQQGDDIVAARTQGRRSICDAFQTQTDALALATHAKAETLQAYVADLNKGLQIIGCTVVAHPRQ